MKSSTHKLRAIFSLSIFIMAGCSETLLSPEDVVRNYCDALAASDSVALNYCSGEAVFDTRLALQQNNHPYHSEIIWIHCTEENDECQCNYKEVRTNNHRTNLSDTSSFKCNLIRTQTGWKISGFLKTLEIPAETILPNSSINLTTPDNPESALWMHVWNSETKNSSLQKARPFNADTLTKESIAMLLNDCWPNVLCKIIRISNDTLYVEIPDSHILTNQMGTSGAQEYFQQATFSFTELQEIRFVNYHFAPGEHAGPSTYSRKSWPLLENLSP